MASIPPGLAKRESMIWPTVEVVPSTVVDTAPDGNVGGIGWNGDAGKTGDWQAVTGDNAAGVAHFEGAVPRKCIRAVGHSDLEKAVAVNGDIQLVTGLVQLAIGEHSGSCHRAGTVAHLHTGRHLIAASGIGAGGAAGLVKHILELDLGFLESGGVHVRQVIGDHVQVHLLGLHSRG